MQLLPWWPNTGEGVLVYVGMLLVYTLGLYVLTRGEGRVAVLACLAMGTFAVYLLGLWAGGLAFPDEPLTWAAWLRATWWGGALSPALWLLLVFVLAVDEGPDAIRARLQAFLLPMAVVVLGLGGLFAVLGVTGELLLRWDDTFPLAPLVVFGSDPLAWHVPPTPLFAAYQVYLIACLVGAAGGLAWLFVSSPRGAPLRSRFGGLLASAVLFLLGGTYMGVASGGLGFSGLPGEVLLVIGMVIMGWNVARYGALLTGEAVAADFRAFFLSTLAVVLLYAALFTFVPRPASWPLGERLLLLIVLTTHALADHSSRIVDRVLFNREARSLRGRLRTLSDRVVRNPDPITALVEVREGVENLTPTTEYRVLVEGALRSMNDVPRLSRHPLLGRTAETVSSDGTALERAVVLRGELEQALERLRPTGTPPRPGSQGAGGWLHYLVLHEAYVEGRLNKHIMQRYYISESTFHRARRGAVDTLAMDLYQRLERTIATPAR
jgi:hypothetical protein